MEDPETYGPVLGNWNLENAVDLRRRLFGVLWLNYASTMYKTGHLTERTLKLDVLQPFFGSEVARIVWLTIRPFWEIERDQSSIHRKFLEIISDEYELAFARGAAAKEDALLRHEQQSTSELGQTGGTSPVTPSVGATPRTKRAFALMLAGALAGYFLGRRRLGSQRRSLGASFVGRR